MKPGWHRRPRREPYTAEGIKRVPCVRCGMPSAFQWQVCADGRAFRAVCAQCDVALNKVVLAFMLHPDVPGVIRRYCEKIARDE